MFIQSDAMSSHLFFGYLMVAIALWEKKPTHDWQLYYCWTAPCPVGYDYFAMMAWPKHLPLWLKRAL
ncbi:Uncharacterised protein [Weissella viridescens]|uniref:Uncharacterized protein n=1 Tax=Weissella viridescens TaxID=1629 RepID=A0A380P2B1_WEIVI|nr:Uncharacterised protein [Weissella viridescens]